MRVLRTGSLSVTIGRHARRTAMNNHPLPPHIQVFTDPAFYPHEAREITMLQTHISWVFLAGDFAYKIKKPVDLGFLDFSSLKARHEACRKELQLNRRLAADIYLDVLPISLQRDIYILDSTGIPVDYCVKMVRFDQDNLLNRQVEQQTFKSEWMDELARQVAAFHITTESSDTDARLQLARHMEANLKAAQKHPEIHLAEAWLNRLKQLSDQYLNALSPRLAQRQEGGHIRDCHGDLHLGNITLFRGRPTPFDCIEFNDDFRTIDTMNDAAFLVMDCDAHNRPELGLRFLSRYLEHTGDYEGLCLLPLYMSYRAGVRGKVACLLADDPGISDKERQSQLGTAADYYRLAERYLHEKRASLFAIGGLSGSGKSHLSLLGMEHEHAVVIRSDATRKRIAPQHADLPLYGDAMHKLTYQTMFDDARTALQTGCPVILDATFLHPGARTAAAALAGELDIPLTFYWLDIAPDELRQRVKERSRTDHDISDADLEVLEGQLSDYRQPDEPFVTVLRQSDRWP